jgi:hypothetical protein
MGWEPAGVIERAAAGSEPALSMHSRILVSGAATIEGRSARPRASSDHRRARSLF